MTPGQKALQEAARLEAAAFYTRPAGDTSKATRAARARRDDRDLHDAHERVRDGILVAASVRAGASVDDLIRAYGLTRAEARNAVAKAAS